MTLATVLYFSLVCVCAAADDSAPLPRNIKAISAAERPRYNDLVSGCVSPFTIGASYRTATFISWTRRK